MTYLSMPRRSLGEQLNFKKEILSFIISELTHEPENLVLKTFALKEVVVQIQVMEGTVNNNKDTISSHRLAMKEGVNHKERDGHHLLVDVTVTTSNKNAADHHDNNNNVKIT